MLKCWVMSHTEEHGEQEGQAQVGQEQQAVSEEEHVEQLLLDPDHPDLQISVWGCPVSH